MNFKRQLCFVFLLLACLSCKQSINDSYIVPISSIDYSVSIEDAIEVAQAQAPLKLNSSNGGAKVASTIADVFSVKPTTDNPSMYVVNYNGGGFSIISGDNRMTPILAFSENAQLSMKEKELPQGLINWFVDASSYITEIRKSNANQNEYIKKRWDKLKLNNETTTDTKKGRISSGTEGCDWAYSFMIEPLLQTTWDQTGTGFNSQMPQLTCNGSTDRAPTGCVATATAQVMRYHEFPTSYNWGSMSSFTGGTETAKLMKDLGTWSNLDMTYGCNASSSTIENIPRTLSNFGYPNTSCSDYSFSGVANELSSHRPVILAGGRQNGWWVFSSYEDGHCWVADGLYQYFTYGSQPDPNTPGECLSVLVDYGDYLHMNWGWRGIANGYFYAYNFNPQVPLPDGTIKTYSFNYKTRMITGIKKP